METVAVREGSRASAEDMATVFRGLSQVLERLRLEELVYRQPSKVARELALSFSRLDQEDKEELVRLASLVEAFAEPLAEYTLLLMYARGMASFARGDLETATAQLDEARGEGRQVQVAGINLSIPEQILKRTQIAVKERVPAFLDRNHIDEVEFEDLFADIVRKADFYLTTDLDRISRETIDQDRLYLEGLDEHFAQVRRKLPVDIRGDFINKSKRIQGWVDQIILDLYVARGYATPDTPRDREYYSRVQATRRSWRNIKSIVKAR